MNKLILENDILQSIRIVLYPFPSKSLKIQNQEGFVRKAIAFLLKPIDE